jgi:SAM-dependent methyltransferase
VDGKKTKFKVHWEESAQEHEPSEVVFGKSSRHQWSRQKDVESFNELKEYLNIEEGNTILDIGCGPLARPEVQYSQSYKILGLDISRTTVKAALREIRKKESFSNTDLVVADSEFLPLRNDAFDVCLCIGMISHLPTQKNVRNTIEEMRRVTKDKIYVPWWINRSSLIGIETSVGLKLADLLRVRHPQFLRFNGFDEIFEICNSSQWKVSRLRYGNLFSSTWLLYFAPKSLKMLLNKVLENLNKFHTNHSFLWRSSGVFEVTLEKRSELDKTELKGYYEFF